jgi:hypothetical protein
MKITIELTEQEVKGIKAYLKEVDDKEKVSKKDIQAYVAGIATGTLHAPQEAVSDYIKVYEKNEYLNA